MSKELLLSLNGNQRGAFYSWLKTLSGEPRIAWYPSAGSDFRDLLYLHPTFSEQMPATTAEPVPADIFLHTDYFPWTASRFLDSSTIHFDFRTGVTVQSIEELPRCDLPLDKGIVDFPKGSHATGRVLFLQVKVSSDALGGFTVPVIYAFVENAAFCAQRMLPNNGQLSHVIHVRYGGGCGGGGRSSGIWLINVLDQLGCECFVTDGHHHRQTGDEHIYRRYPELAGPEDTGRLVPIRTVPSKSWSGHGDVSWNIVKPV